MAYGFKGIGGLVGIMNPIVNKHEFRHANDRAITINEALSHGDNVMKNLVWLRGDTYELQQLYQKLKAQGKRDNFWSDITGQSRDVKRIHSGLASRMVKAMAYVCLSDMHDIEFESEADTELWKEIAKENQFNVLLDDALKKVLALGDGAFKITYEEAFTEKPIIEFYSADEVEFVRHRGRVQEVIFKTEYEENGNVYVLKERYGYGYIINNLYLNGEECVLSDCSYTAGINDYYFGGGDGQHGVVNSKGDYKLAIPFILYASAKYAGRGESIFDERESLFASLDGDLSMWQESVDAGAPKTGVSKSLLDYDPNTGNPIIPDGLTRYFLLEDVKSADGNGGKLGIEQIQFDIPWQSYYETHASFLDSILMGFMSPATLGIDVGKVDSGESVREKQTMTMHTRSYIVEAMSEIVKELAKTAVQSYYDYWKLNQMATEPSVDFGDYASPTSDAKAETITKCKQGGFMSIRTAVKEYHGDSKSEEWIDEEVARIKEDMNIGFADVEEPSFGGDVDYPSADNKEDGEFIEIEEEPEEE